MTTNFKNNKSLCIFPWIENYQGSRYERKYCCISDDLKGLEKTTEEEFFNSVYMKETRLDMLAGTKRPECHACYQNEDNNILSLREEATFEQDGSLKNNFEELVQQTKEDGSVDMKPTYYDSRTIHCNLQCVSCGIVYSSRHIDLFLEMFGKDTLDNARGNGGTPGNPFKVDKKHEAQTAKEMEAGLEEKRITGFYWAGGEPFMSPVHWTVMEKILELKEKPGYKDYIDNLRIHYNTNLTRREWKRKPISQILNKYKHLRIEASLDGTHETLEYTRDGAIWNEIENNWKEFSEAGITMEVASVLTAPVIFDVDRYIEFFEQWPGMRIANHLYMINQRDIGMQSTLDICFWPDHIFYPAMDKAVNAFKKSSFFNKEKTIDILNYYYKQKEELKSIFNNPKVLSAIKSKTVYRDEYQKTISLPDLLAITHPEAREWYLNLPYNMEDYFGYHVDLVRDNIKLKSIPVRQI